MYKMTKPKYRRLTPEEMELLREDFIHFLVAHGIDSKEWIRLKEKQMEKAEGWFCLFSDFVLEKALSRVNYIEHFDGVSLKCFKFDVDRVLLVVLESHHTFDNWQDMKSHAATHPEVFSVYSSDKLYNKDRNSEIFQLLDAGGLISGPENYDAIRQSMEKMSQE